MRPGSTSQENDLHREWIWEYVLKHCSNIALVRALAEAYPVPNNSLRVKRFLLLKSLSFEDQISDRTLETLEKLASIYRSKNGPYSRVPYNLQKLLLTVRIECTVRYLRRESDDWPKFYQSLQRYWGDSLTGEELNLEPEFLDQFAELKRELWSIQKKPDLRHGLLEKHKKDSVMKLMQAFLSDAWKDVGSVFLELVADNLEKGLYKVNSLTGDLKKNCERVNQTPHRVQNNDIMESPGLICQRLTEIYDRKTHSNMIAQSLTKNSDSRPLSEKSSDVLMPPPNSTLIKNNVLHGSNEQIHDVLEQEAGEGSDIGKNNLGQKRRESLKNKRRIPETLQNGKKWNPCADRVSQSHDPFSSGDYLNQNLHTQEDLGCPSVLTRDDVCRAMQNKMRGKIPDARMESVQFDEDIITNFSPPPWVGDDNIGSPSLRERATTGNKRRKLAPYCSDENQAVRNTPDKHKGLQTPEIIKAQMELREANTRLCALVKDPLQDAIKIAEDAAKSSRLLKEIPDSTDNILPVDDHDRGVQSSPHQTNLTSSHTDKSVQPPKEKRARSLMDRNPTAHTFQWDTSDDIQKSSDEVSPSRSRQVHLPRLTTRQSGSGSAGVFSQKGLKRRKIKRWTQEEEETLRKEVHRLGKGRWKHILQTHSEIFEGRTEVDLKDKWRNIEKREGIL